MDDAKKQKVKADCRLILETGNRAIYKNIIEYLRTVDRDQQSSIVISMCETGRYDETTTKSAQDILGFLGD